MSAAIDGKGSDGHKDPLEHVVPGSEDAGDLGTDRDPALTAEAAFEPNNPDARDALALVLFPDSARKRGQFRLVWDMWQQRHEEGKL